MRPLSILVLRLLASGSLAGAGDLASLYADRAAIERVYYNHRVGTKPAFAATLPHATLAALVQKDLRQETVLRQHYGIVISPTLLEAEVQRIHATTRAPEMLAEIQAALGHDPARFANTFAKPILVERLLRDKFDNDDAFHAATRRACEAVRARLLAAKTNGASPAQLLAHLQCPEPNAVTETTWQLTPRPAQTNAPAAAELEIRKRFGPNAQRLASPGELHQDRKYYFDDLPLALQNVLRVQLRRPGDVSAVIETPDGFLLYLAREKSDLALGVACLTVPKRSLEQWLEETH